MTHPSSHRYDAFVSYRHVEPDRTWAKWLCRSLETFRTPTALVRGGTPRRIKRVFRDEEEVAAAANLSDEIDAALEASRFLIVVCSPRTPPSKWVSQEVSRFRELGRHDAILALLIEGEPGSSFPDPLREIRHAVIDDRGRLKEEVESLEPLAADVRVASHESARNRKRMALLRLAAPVLGCRFDDLRRRESERRRKRLMALSTGLAVLVMAFGVLTLHALSEGRRADEQRARAEAHLEQVLGTWLVDREEDLWPIHPERVPAMDHWIDEARGWLRKKDQFEANLARVSARGTHAEFGTPHFEDRADRRAYALQREKVAAARALSGSEGLLEQVLKRRAQAAGLHDATITKLHEEWANVTTRIAKGDKYPGLTLAPQLGLVPLGPDPTSGLEEFAHHGSGVVPTRDTEGRLILDEHSAIVLVLIRAGEFFMGSQRTDEDRPNYDKSAEQDESPVLRRRIERPFFLGKHEISQAQWSQMTGGGDPSTYRAGLEFGTHVLTRRNPVDQVSWADCVGTRRGEGWLRRHRLTLPTEMEWEYACRAGTDSPWCVGRELEMLSDVANVADCFLMEHAPGSAGCHAIHDGHSAPAPIGTYKPNAFGLYDMHGNVYEWCISIKYDYAKNGKSDRTRRAARGGSWFQAPEKARSANRAWAVPHDRGDETGVRPAMAIQE